jgi:hypothetical protein
MLDHPGIDNSVHGVDQEAWRSQSERAARLQSHQQYIVLFKYSLTNDGEVQCLKGVPCINLSGLREYCWKERSGTAKVLVLEMEVCESDPTPGCMPTMLTLSSPQTEDRYKTLSKRMGTMVQLIGPHTPTEVDMMAQLLFQVDVEGIKDAESNSDLEEESYLKMIQERVAEIGPWLERSSPRTLTPISW